MMIHDDLWWFMMNMSGFDLWYFVQIVVPLDIFFQCHPTTVNLWGSARDGQLSSCGCGSVMQSKTMKLEHHPWCSRIRRHKQWLPWLYLTILEFWMWIFQAKTNVTNAQIKQHDQQHPMPLDLDPSNIPVVYLSEISHVRLLGTERIWANLWVTWQPVSWFWWYIHTYIYIYTSLYIYIFVYIYIYMFLMEFWGGFGDVRSPRSYKSRHFQAGHVWGWVRQAAP